MASFQSELRLDMILVGANTIESLALYDANDNCVGEAENIGSQDGKWPCEVRHDGKTFRKDAVGFEGALAYLQHKRNELFPGGDIVAVAEFIIDPPDRPTE